MSDIVESCPLTSDLLQLHSADDCSRVAAECRSGSIREMKWNDASNETHRTHRSDERSTNDVYTVNSQVYVRLTNTNTLQSWRDSLTVGTISNVETSYFTQLKICYLMTTFRCPLDILIIYNSMEHVTWKSPGPTCGWVGRILHEDVHEDTDVHESGCRILPTQPHMGPNHVLHEL